MVEAYHGFKASTGKICESEFEAWKEELRVWLKKHGVDNDAIAAAVVRTVDDGRPETLATLARIVEGMTKSAPPVVVAAPAGAPLIRCMGGHFCNHAPSTCTATTETIRAGCAHISAVVQHNGDGTTVEFCPDCGRNIAVDGERLKGV